MAEGQSRLKRKLEKAGALVSVNKNGIVKAVQFVGKRTKDKHMDYIRTHNTRKTQMAITFCRSQ